MLLIERIKMEWAWILHLEIMFVNLVTLEKAIVVEQIPSNSSLSYVAPMPLSTFINETPDVEEVTLIAHIFQRCSHTFVLYYHLCANDV